MVMQQKKVTLSFFLAVNGDIIILLRDTISLLINIEFQHWQSGITFNSHQDGPGSTPARVHQQSTSQK